MIKAAILGASGYTGAELLRILANHPEVEVVSATSRQYTGTPVTSVYPALAGFYDGLVYSDPAGFAATGADVVFSALPHGASHEVVPDIVKSGAKVVDLSADFRLNDPEVYKNWYGEHGAVELIKEAVYGLPELHREAVKGAALVANPGCYPTGAILALGPLFKGKLLDPGRPLVIDSKSGASGAGRKASLDSSFVEVTENFKAYKIGSHRHTPEIEQELGGLSGVPASVTFTPHLLPVSRGILTTAYAWLSKDTSIEELHDLYRTFYQGEPFVRLMPNGSFPDIRQVRCSNFCDVGLHYDEKDKKVIAISAIDNLVKGASGQAVQNMNILFGLEETTALATPPASI